MTELRFKTSKTGSAIAIRKIVKAANENNLVLWLSSGKPVVTIEAVDKTEAKVAKRIALESGFEPA